MTTHPTKILLVEDNITLNDAFSMLLERKGYTIRSAYNGQEALDALKEYDADIILLDLLMPVMDGKEFLQKFHNTKHIPIIVLSNLDAKAEVQRALDLGATHYMLKAWASPQELIRVIDDMVKRSSNKSRPKMNAR